MTEKIALLNQKLSTMNNNESRINQTVNKTMHINVKKSRECYSNVIYPFQDVLLVTPKETLIASLPALVLYLKAKEIFIFLVFQKL